MFHWCLFQLLYSLCSYSSVLKYIPGFLEKQINVGLRLVFGIFLISFLQHLKRILPSDLMESPNFYGIIKRAIECILVISYCKGERSFTTWVIILYCLLLLSVTARNKQWVFELLQTQRTESKVVICRRVKERLEIPAF